MNIVKNRSQTPCFWETQPGGCQKPHCVFFHRKPNQVPQRVVTVPMPPVTKTSASEANETVALKKETKVIEQNSVGGAVTIPKATVAPILDTLAAQVPPTTKGLEAKPSFQKRPENAGCRTVVTSVDGITSPKKVVIKKDEPIKNVKERLGGLNNSGVRGLEFGVKTLEQIHREKALASMKKKQDDDIPVQTPSFNDIKQSDLVSAGRKIILKNGGNSEGELSDPCNSPGRKVEVTTSDTENGRVKGNVKGRLGPIAGELTPPRSGDSSPGDNSSKSKAVAEIRLVKPVSSTVISPSKRLRKRKPDSEAIHVLRPAIKVQRVAATKKQAKPAMQIYRPPRAANPVEPEHDRFISKKPNKSETTESSKVQIRKKVVANFVPQELPVKETVATSLLRKPLLKDNKHEEKRVMEKVRVKTLDEILAEKRKKSPEQASLSAREPVDRSAPVTSSSATPFGSSAERKRCLARKRCGEDSVDADDIPDSDRSALRLLKRRKLSVENQRNRSEVNGQASSSEEVSEDAFDRASSARSTAKEETQNATCCEGKESLLLDDDSLFDDDFLLGEASDSFVAKTIKDDDELFEEIQSLLK